MDNISFLPDPGTLSRPPQFQRGDTLTPEQAMTMALMIALQGLGHVSPNPLVGAVCLDKDNKLIGWGAHRQFGQAHAEIEALKDIERNGLSHHLYGAHFFVTLEPCAHTGKTPPCAAALAKLPLSTVTYAAPDPNPLVNGKGAAIIQQAGITCKWDKRFALASEELLTVFLHNQFKKRPFTSLKIASSLDGVVGREGQSKFPITGHEAQRYGHFLRQWHDGILIGRATLEIDNPSLTCRLSWSRARTPKRFVLDPEGKTLLQLIDPSKPLWAILEDETSPVTWVVRDDLYDDLKRKIAPVTKRRANVHLLACQRLGYTRSIDLLSLSCQLKAVGVTSLLVEGGRSTYHEFLKQGLVDRLYLFQSPRLLGYQDGIRWNDESLQVVLQAHPVCLERPCYQIFGDDILVRTDVNPYSTNTPS